MTIQATTFALLAAQPALVAAVPTERWFRRGAQVDASLTPYIVLGWDGDLVTSGRTGPQGLTVYVHDAIGSYKRIGDIHAIIKPVLLGTTHFQHSPTATPYVCGDFLGYGPEDVDQGNGTSVQTSSWKILGGAA